MSSGLKGYSKPWGDGTPVWVRDDAANDSDKSFTVPAGKVWSLKSVHAELATTATVGNRNLAVSMTDGTNPINIQARSAAIAASKTGVVNVFMGGGFYSATTQYNPLLTGAVPDIAFGASYQYECILPAGYVIRVYDVAAIDPNADDLTVVLHYVEYDA